MAAILWLARCLAWWLLLASCSAVDSPNTTYPQIVEVDLIFPRNDTYAPVPIMPVVFAVQNFHAAKPLYLDFYYTFSQVPYVDRDSSRGGMYLHKANFSKSEPFFSHGYTFSTNNSESLWEFVFIWSAGNCSKPEDRRLPLQVDTPSKRVVVYFTTKKGAKVPNLVAATEDGVCDKSYAHAFNITGLLEVDSGSRYYDNIPACPVLSDTKPTTNPCGAKIDAAAASSISYGIQSTACIGGASPFVTCPPGAEDKKSLAPMGVQLSIRPLALLMATVSWLIYV